MSTNNRDDTSTPFRKELNVHGFGFHYAVIGAIEDVNRQRHYGLEFIGAEIPISLNGHETHADFIFFSPLSRAYLIAECKRVDPSLSRWCFARSRYTIGGGSPLIDELHFPNRSEDRLHLRVKAFGRPDEAYQVGIAVKDSRKTGEGAASDRDAISRSVTQVLRAANGFVEVCRDNPGLVRRGTGGDPVQIVPAVFTTATLFRTGDDLSIADLISGDLPASVNFSEVKWLWFQHPLNQSLQAKVPGRFVAEETSDWPSYFRRSATRSVAIVSSEGIAGFLDDIDKRCARA